MTCDFFYSGESNKFSFYRIPRELIKGEEFRGISTDAKLLYGLLLDRMGLSEKNNWRDEDNRVFIYYPQIEIQEDLQCGHDKARKLLAELDGKKGIGLIQRVHQGLGKPDRIYVMQFGPDKNKIKSDDNCNSVSNIAKFECSAYSENRGLDGDKTAGSYTNNNYTDNSYINLSISEKDIEDMIEDVEEQIEYGLLEEMYPNEDIDGIVSIICEVLCSRKGQISVGRELLPTYKVQERFRRLEFPHIAYVFDSIESSSTKIKNVKSYLITALYNAPITMDMYYSSAVRHDMYGEKNG